MLPLLRLLLWFIGSLAGAALGFIAVFAFVDEYSFGWGVLGAAGGFLIGAMSPQHCSIGSTCS